MITIERTTPFKPTQSTTTAPIERTRVVESEGAHRGDTVPVLDRRKSKDRRRLRKKNNILLESRSGKDRRKNTATHHRSIDIQA